MEVYQSLKSPWDIRLLQIHPGNPADPLSVSLHTCCLKDEPAYEALSYVWGDPRITRQIICNGIPANITVNLFSALACFRLPDKPRTLWADAICINQQDLDERASQVQIMHLVYRNCRTCLVWLGPEDEHLPVAQEIINTIVSLVCTRFSISEEELDNHLRRNGRDMLQAQEIGFNGLPGPDPQVWASLLHFFGRPWFSRVWVIQEVYFAPEVLFFCDKKVASFAALFHTADWLLTNAQYIEWSTNPDSLQHYTKSLFSNLLAMRNDEKSQNDRYLEDVLNSCKGFNSTDPRDKVYALMNLPPFTNEYPGLIPDYHLSTEDVFADVTIAISNYHKSLSVLTLVDHGSDETERTFPSWVPRWHREDTKPNVSSMWYHFFSAGLCSESVKFSARLLPGNILPLSGLEFDTIQDICTIQPRGDQKTRLDKPNFIPNEAWEPYDPSSLDGPYRSKPDIIAAYAMTLTAMCREHRGVFALKCTPGNYVHHFSDFVAWLQWLRSDDGIQSGHYPPGLYSEVSPFLPDTSDEEAHEFAMRYHTMVKSYTLGRKLIRTRKGYLGLARHTVQAGDLVCIALGGALPLLLRRRDEGDYTYVGDVYIHGIMHGEAMQPETGRSAPFQVFNIH